MWRACKTRAKAREGAEGRGVETLAESAVELIGSHRGSVRRREDCPRRRIYGRVTGFTHPAHGRSAK
jgi:hypothetical protein